MIRQTGPYSLREWTEEALQSTSFSARARSRFSVYGIDPSAWPLDVKRELAITSDQYLTSALRIALSLADQVCKAEESLSSSSQGVTNGGSPSICLNSSQGLQHYLPAPSSDWAERTAVYFSSPKEKYPLDEGTFNGKGIHPIVHGITNFGPRTEPTAVFKDDKREGNGRHVIPFQNVSNAEILPHPLDNNNGRTDDKYGRLHSLGLVFYELFSAGKRPVEGETHQLYEPLPTSAFDSIDFASSLQILENLDDGENDEAIPQQHDPLEVRQRSKKTRSSQFNDGNRGKKTNFVSTEPLKLLGLPSSLCELIYNMLDCVNGDLCRNDAYREMSDVRSDLQLMLDNPEKFLYDLDIEKLSVTGLQFNEDIFFDRDAQFMTLMQSYRRSIANVNELSVIFGPSGVGKSVLAGKVAQSVINNGGIFLSGKFDQLEQNKPFSAVAAAFNQYCDVLYKEGRSSNATAVSSQLKETLGRDLIHLVRVVPNLQKVLGNERYLMAVPDSYDCVDGQKRLQFLLCQFVEVISTLSPNPITLFLDDLQWADQASIDVIKNLLLSQLNQFFFLVCCRDDEISDEHPVSKMISALRHFCIETTTIKLECLDISATNKMVSNLLCLSPRLTRTLSELIHHKTKGNPLFFSQLMISLSKEGLIYLSLSRRRWDWEEEKIQNRELPDDVAAYFTSTIRLLPQETQSAMCVLACFGSSTERSLIETLQSKIGLPLLQPLEVAVAEGLLDSIGGKFRFVHDRLQESAYLMIDPAERGLKHFKYGIALSADSLDMDHCPFLFSSVGQINRGGPSLVSSALEGETIAKLNLLAGKKALEMSDFATASYFFDFGISFLPKNHWTINYDLSLELFDAAAKCAMTIGDFVRLNILSDQVITFARSFEDQLNVLYAVIVSLETSSRLDEAVAKGVSILSTLGVELPRNITDSDIATQLEKTRVMCHGMSNDDFIRHKPMVDSSKLMVMKFLARLEHATFMVNPDIQIIVTLKIVELSMTHGMSPVASVGFAYFGSLLAKTGNIAEGYQVVKIAKSLLDRFGSKEVAGDVTAVSTSVMCFVEPIQATNEIHLQGYTDAMAAGDITQAIFNQLCYNTYSFAFGCLNLSVVRKNFLDHHRFVEQQNNFDAGMQVLPFLRAILMLTGTQSSISKAQNNESQLEMELLEKNPFHSRVFFYNKMYTSFIFRRFEDTKVFAKKYAGKVFNYLAKSWVLILGRSQECYIYGLVSFWVYRKTNDFMWAEWGQQCLCDMRLWAVSSEWNFEHRRLALEAENHYCNKDYEAAAASYEKAITLARNHKFINDEAFSLELAGHFYYDIGKKQKSIGYFMQAHEKYHEWGAFAKASDLFEHVTGLVGFNLEESKGAMQGNGANLLKVKEDL